MPKYVVEFRYTVGREGRAPLHPAHAENLRRLADEKTLLLAGPLEDVNGGLLLYDADDEDHLRRLLAEEPYVRGGIVAETRIRRWNPGKGSWITALSQEPAA